MTLTSRPSTPSCHTASRLSCRAAGASRCAARGLPARIPEAAFAWTRIPFALSDRYRCVAPNLRGFERSSAPEAVEAYRAKHLMADIEALVAHRQAVPPVATRHAVASRWSRTTGARRGGVGFAALRPHRLGRLVIVSPPHPATFLRELLHSPSQQAASAY